MVVRCSLIGHSYGETEIDRDREERGSEVVVTVVEYEVCSRCGTRSVLSENTEVTTKHTGEMPDPDESSVADESPVTDESADSPSTAAGETAAPDTAATADGATGNDSGAMGFDEEAPPIPTDEDGEPITDDAEILDEDPEERPDRGHGEWPEAEDVGPPEGAEAEPAAWPDEGSPVDEGGDAVGDDPATADEGPIDTGEILTDDEPEVVDRSPGVDDAPGTGAGNDDPTDDESADAADVSVANADPAASRPGDADGADSHADAVGRDPQGDATGRDPQADATGGDPQADATSADEPRTVPRSGIESAGAAPNPADSPRRSDVPTEFFCPRCSFVATDARASLRAGDICPECKRGYLGERER